MHLLKGYTHTLKRTHLDSDFLCGDANADENGDSVLDFFCVCRRGS